MDAPLGFELMLLALAWAATLLVRPWRLLRPHEGKVPLATTALALVVVISWLWAWPGLAALPIPLPSCASDGSPLPLKCCRRIGSAAN